MILEANMPRETMLKREKDSVCAECGAALSVAWGGAHGYQCYVLRCGRDTQHQGIERPRIPTAEEAGLPYANPKRDRKRRLELEKTGIATEKAKGLEVYQTRQSLAQHEAQHILRTVWPQAPDVEVVKAALVCARYGLNPLMKHLFLVPYMSQKTGRTTWAMVIGIKATRLLASRRGRYSYVEDTPRVMTADEQVRVFGEADPQTIWAITVVKDEHGNIARGYGNWPKGAMPQGTDKGNSKANMAFIRSERQALDRLFPDCLPAGAEVVDETFVEVGGEQVDRTTGELAGPELSEDGSGSGEAPAEPLALVGFVDRAWLESSLKALQARKLKAWTNAAVIADLEGRYSVTGQSVTEAVGKLTKEQAEEFCQRIQTALMP